MSRKKLTLDQFRTAVSARMEKLYGISWADACGDDPPLSRALEDRMTPSEFVDSWGAKYDLIKVREAR